MKEEDIPKKAKELAGKYGIIIQQDDNYFNAYYLDFPEIKIKCLDISKCLSKLESSLITYFEGLLKEGKSIPSPDARNQQVNIRFTPDEKELIQEQAKKEKKNVSDYIRNILGLNR